MQITGVSLLSNLSADPLIFSFEDPASENPYQVNGMTGLDVDEIQRKFYGTGGSGQKFYDRTLPKRDVTVRLGLNPQWADGQTHSDLRDQLYRTISSSRTGSVYLAFYNGEDVVALLVGEVVKMEAALFESKQEMQVSLECKDPMLRAPLQLEVDIEGLDPADTTITDNVSTAPHGAVFLVKFTGDEDTFVINGDEESFFSVTPIGVGGFQVDDTLLISNEYGARGVVMWRGTTPTVIADGIDQGSSWPIIFPGDNHFECVGDVEWEYIKHTPTYWGV